MCTGTCPNQYQCYQCTRNVFNHLCAVQCGTCYTIQTVYRYNTTFGPVDSTTTQKCSRNDINCMNGWISSHPINSPVQCWYDKQNPNDGAEFGYPIHQNNIPARVFAIIFAIGFGISILVLLYLCNFRCE